jgi:hypothetical protein
MLAAHVLINNDPPNQTRWHEQTLHREFFESPSGNERPENRSTAQEYAARFIWLIRVFEARASRHRTVRGSDRMLTLNRGLRARRIAELNVASGRYHPLSGTSSLFATVH